MISTLPRVPRLANNIWVFRFLLALGGVLLLVSFVPAVIDRTPRTPASVNIEPRVEVRAKFAGLAQDGQTTGFAVAPDGTLAVVDRIRKVVIRLDATGAPVAEWGPRFEPEVDAEDLAGIAAAGSDWYLLDRGRNTILRLDANGRATRSIDLTPLATYGPNGLATDSVGNLYLADTGANRILVFNSAGMLLQTIGSAGTGLGQLKQPTAISFGPDGAMYVSDFENSRVERWNAAQEATNSWSLTVHPWGIATDGLGRTFVTDADHRNVRMFGPGGDVLADIGTQRNGVLVNFPTQLGVSPDGSTLWVLGNDGLAHVDLTPFSQTLPAPVDQKGGGIPFPIAALGAALVAVGAAPLVRWPRSGPASAPPRSYPVDAPRPIPARPIVEGRTRTLLGAGIAITCLGLAGAVFSQLSLSGPTAKNSPWLGLGVLVLSGILWAIGCIMSARALPFAWISEWPTARPSLLQTLTTAELIRLVLEWR